MGADQLPGDGQPQAAAPGTGAIALPELDERTVGLSLDELAGDRISIGLAAGAGRGPITLAALRAKCVNAIVVDSDTAEWVLAHG